MNTVKETKKNLPLLITDEGRQCTECNEFKLWDEFPVQRAHKTGHKARCKICNNTHQKPSKQILAEEFKTSPLITNFVIYRTHLKRVA
tara:strand:+ start:38306 stop:38569 length:264 start_codon:yes stop_codon:yes gene_type:complete